MAPVCPLCSVAVSPADSVCPNCGAKLSAPPKALNQLLDDLEDVSRTADAAVVEEDRVVNAAIQDLESAHRDDAAVEPRHTDPSAFAKRVATLGKTDLDSRMGHYPPRHSLAPPMVAIGAILAAGGLSLMPSAPPVGTVVMLAGVALMGVGAFLHGLRLVAQ